jgi:hypothetical protein
MSLHAVALTRGTARAVFSIEAPDFETVLEVVIPFLADDAHIAHAGSDETMVHLAILRHEAARAQAAFEEAVARVREAEGVSSVPPDPDTMESAP